MLDGFERRRATVNGTEIHFAIGGSGPPLLLLHGYPQTHVIWHRIAPRLAASHTVVCPDLRGYGDSDKPRDGYDKKTMARDMHEVMQALGHERYALVGHDRLRNAH
jgi:haloacetate dehalogenase